MEYIVGITLGFLLGRFSTFEEDFSLSTIFFRLIPAPKTSYYFGQEVKVIGGFHKGQIGVIEEKKFNGRVYNIAVGQKSSPTMPSFFPSRDYLDIELKDLELTPKELVKGTKNYEPLED